MEINDSVHSADEVNLNDEYWRNNGTPYILKQLVLGLEWCCPEIFKDTGRLFCNISPFLFSLSVCLLTLAVFFFSGYFGEYEYYIL